MNEQESLVGAVGVRFHDLCRHLRYDSVGGKEKTSPYQACSAAGTCSLPLFDATLTLCDPA